MCGIETLFSDRKGSARLGTPPESSRPRTSLSERMGRGDPNLRAMVSYVDSVEYQPVVCHLNRGLKLLKFLVPSSAVEDPKKCEGPD